MEPGNTRGWTVASGACFLRLELMRLTDTSLDLIDQQIASQWRLARERAGEGQYRRLQRFRGLDAVTVRRIDYFRFAIDN